MSDYAFIHAGTAYTPNKSAIDAALAKSHNAIIEAKELELWDAGPDSFLAYYDDKQGEVSTWLGTAIGRIASYRIYRHNFGGRLISLRVKGSNGLDYYGRASYDNGNCITLRRSRKVVR